MGMCGPMLTPVPTSLQSPAQTDEEAFSSPHQFVVYKVCSSSQKSDDVKVSQFAVLHAFMSSTDTHVSVRPRSQE